MKKILILLLMVVFMVAGALIASAHINDGIISYYPFDENADDVMDQNSIPLPREEQIVRDGNAPCGDGYVVLEKRKDILMLTGADALGPYFDDDEMTIALWVKPAPEEQRNLTILGFGSGANYDYFRFAIGENDKLFFYFQSDDKHFEYKNNDTNILRDGNWHHIAMTAKIGESPVFYIDGEAYALDDSDYIQKFIGDSTGYFVIGGMNGGEDNYLGGIDDLRIYGRALDEDEIAELIAMKGTTPEKPEPRIDTFPVDSGWDDPDPWDDETDETQAKPATDKPEDTKKPADSKANDSDVKKSNTGLIIGIAAAAVVVVAVVLGIVLSKKKK